MPGPRFVGPLAAPLAALIGLPGCGGGGSSLPEVKGPTSPRLDLVATEMRFTPAEIAVPAGSVDVVLRNQGVVRHDLRIEGRPELLVEVTPGETATARWELTRGRYRTYCSIPGHRPAGMEGVLELR